MDEHITTIGIEHAETADDLVRDLFEREGRVEIVAGNTPFLLADPGSVWLVDAGRVEVFSVAVTSGAATGPRHHFLSALPGDLLFGVDLDRYGEGQGLLAVGVVGTRTRRLDARHLRELAATGWCGSHLGAMIDRWISGLSSGSSRTIVPHPRADLTVDPGEESRLDAGKRFKARKGVVWTSIAGEGSLFLGMEDVPEAGDGILFPLTTDTWMQSLGPVDVRGVATAEALRTERGWRGIEAFYSALLRCEFFNTHLAAADELNRLTEKAARERRLQESALEALAEVIEPRRASVADALAGAVDDDALLAAVGAIGRYLGIPVQAPPKPKDGEAPLDRLNDITRSSGCRTRVVVLNGKWWRQDGGPLLAHTTVDRAPVAILPRRGGGFEIHDEQARAPRRLTPSVAATLEPFAHAFYRPFPDRTLHPIDLLRFGLRNAGRDLAVPLAVALGAGLLGTLPPYFIGLLVDTVIPEAARDHLLQLGVVLAVVSITLAMFEIVRRLGVLRLETQMSAAIQPALWDRLLALPVSFFRRFSAGDLAQRVGAIDAIRRVLSGAVIETMLASVFSVFLFAQLFLYDVPLALVAGGLTLVAVAATIVFGYAKLAAHREVMAREGRISGFVLQLLTGIAKLRVTRAEGRAFAVWAREFAPQKRIAGRANRAESRLAVFNAAFPIVSSMAIFAALLKLRADDVTGQPLMSTGEFVAFNAAAGLFLAQMVQLGSTAMSALAIIPYYERARPILQTQPEVDRSKADPGELTGRIQVSRVSFRYQPDGPLILNDVSMDIRAGEFIAIVGPSGSGKSTLIRLLLGLEPPGTGSIYYDGRDVATLDVQKLRRKIGVVMQAAKIRAGSIFSNIVGAARMPVEEAAIAARMAGLEDDIRQMPMGMHTVLQQGGGSLSGGQRQRLMIARAIVGRPRILLFDEATSALDNRTQAIVSRSLEELQATRIAIAHRLSTIVNADRIYVLEAGRVVQTGTYRELAATPGLFADLTRRQIA